MSVKATFEITDKEAIDLNEYNGSYELISKYGGYQNWAKYRIGKDAYSEKDRPVKVSLGNEQTAVRTLLAILESIVGCAYVPAGGESEQAQDIPF